MSCHVMNVRGGFLLRVPWIACALSRTSCEALNLIARCCYVRHRACVHACMPTYVRSCIRPFVRPFVPKLSGGLPDTEEYAAVLKEQYSLITAENACKWHATEPEQGQFDFTGCDYLLGWCVHRRRRRCQCHCRCRCRCRCHASRQLSSLLFVHCVRTAAVLGTYSNVSNN